MCSQGVNYSGIKNHWPLQHKIQFLKSMINYVKFKFMLRGYHTSTILLWDQDDNIDKTWKNTENDIYYDKKL